LTKSCGGRRSPALEPFGFEIACDVGGCTVNENSTTRAIVDLDTGRTNGVIEGDLACEKP
jgi:hypothetical protein